MQIKWVRSEGEQTLEQFLNSIRARRRGGTIGIEVSRTMHSDEPPLQLAMRFKADLRGYTSVVELLEKLTHGREEQFPIERELAMYLLFVATLWPDNEERLVTAARLFTYALNIHSERPAAQTYIYGYTEDLKSEADKKGKKTPTYFVTYYQRKHVREFVTKMTEKVGGIETLLATQAVDDFHRSVSKELHKYRLAHDVIEYVLRASTTDKKLASLNTAYSAVAANVFGHQKGYGVKRGVSRNSSNPGSVTSLETVRAAWKSAPKEVLLNYVLAFHYDLAFNPLSSPWLYMRLAERDSTNYLARANATFLRYADRRNKVARDWQGLKKFDELTKWHQPLTEDQIRLVRSKHRAVGR